MDIRVEKYLSNLMVDRCGDVHHEWRWAHELELLQLIKDGRPDLIEDTLAKSRKEYYQTIEDINLARQEEERSIYHLISAVTLFSRAAIEGGVPEVLAFSMMESYIFCASKYRSDFFMDAVYSFAGAVADYKIEAGESNSQIKEIKSYIMENLNNRINVSSIAKLLHLSPSRCSHLFKEKTGMTIHHYIEKERIKAACAYLAYTDMSVSSLSEYLVFSSPSHFASVFSRHTGFAPKEWQKRFRRGEISH